MYPCTKKCPLNFGSRLCAANGCGMIVHKYLGAIFSGPLCILTEVCTLHVHVNVII